MNERMNIIELSTAKLIGSYIYGIAIDEIMNNNFNFQQK